MTHDTPQSKIHAHSQQPPDAIPADRRALLASIGGLAAGALFAGAHTAHAGPLNPPPGPIASTGKTLTEVEPRIAINSTNTPGNAAAIFRITQPGSYYLTGNITGVFGLAGIEIAASNVTIDLNGFAMIGVSGSGTGIITDPAPRNNIRIHNGVVIGWDGSGIVLVSLGSGHHIADVRSIGNVGTGVSVGTNALIERSAAVQNGIDGFAASTGAVVRACTATSNAVHGFDFSGNATVSDCNAISNDGSGFQGASGGIAITNCTSLGNSGTGFFLLGSSTIRNCVSNANIINNFNIGSGSTILGCAAEGSNGNGILANTRCRIESCVVGFNIGNGISTASDALILNNTADSNSGSGIQATGNDNRIEMNNCTDNATGIEVVGTGNIILRNTCSGNSLNFDISVSNRYGPIVNIIAAGAAAVSGNSAPSTLAAPSSAATTDPHANFAF